MVSTHSRLKAAGKARKMAKMLSMCFNTQPPEGGWADHDLLPKRLSLVSTHSRLKAAGSSCTPYRAIRFVSTHSRLKAAGPNRATNKIQT